MMMMLPRPKPDAVQPGQESVWDYPRPPRVEPCGKRIVVRFADRVLADTTRSQRVLETSHPPVYYLPLSDVDESMLRASGDGGSMCEFKGRAKYFDVVAGDRVAERAAFTYPNPTRGMESLRDHVAIYAGLMDAVEVNGERAAPQEGGFYAGWITSDVVGPFKGGPGTRGW